MPKDPLHRSEKPETQQIGLIVHICACIFFASVRVPFANVHVPCADRCCPHVCFNFQRLVEDPIDGLHLQLQLAVVCDVGRVITKATYTLESDTPMIEKVTWNGFNGSFAPPICVRVVWEVWWLSKLRG